MPVGKTMSTKRGKSMVLAGLLVAAVSGWYQFIAGKAPDGAPITPQIVHEAVDKGITPPAVAIAMDLISPWEGMRTRAYIDAVGVPTICKGETEVDGKPVRLGMEMTEKQCEAQFARRLTHDYYLKLVDGLKDYVLAPDSVQAAALSVAYNSGNGVLLSNTSTAGNAIRRHDYDEACRGLTLFNKGTIKGRRVELPGLTARRGMGDKTRVGEAEVCLSTEVAR